MIKVWLSNNVFGKIKKAAADDETTDKDEVKGLEVKKPAADGHEKNPVTTKKEEDKTDNGQGRADKEDSTKKVRTVKSRFKARTT